LGFDLFWAAWPRGERKTGKAKCKAVWKKKKLDPQAAKILKVLEAMKKSDGWTKENGHYIPAPLVWLNQDRFDCDLEDLQRENIPPAEKLNAAGETLKQQMDRIRAERASGERR
jgi:hypothetical protein